MNGLARHSWGDAKSGVLLLSWQFDFPDCHLGQSYGISDAAHVNVDHPLGDQITEGIPSIHQVELAQGVVEGQLKNMFLFVGQIDIRISREIGMTVAPCLSGREHNWSLSHRLKPRTGR